MVKIPRRYVPVSLTSNDAKRQLGYINKSRKSYKNGKYFVRPKVKSYKSRKSNHLQRLKSLYNVNARPSRELELKSKCKMNALSKIVSKGKGAYLSAGSRPNQTPESWGYARLASALTGGNASIVDYSILKNGCRKTSKSLKLAESLIRKNKTKKRRHS
jgi:hypothetical protein